MLWAVLTIAAPVVAVVMIVGLIVSILQVATQLQEMTLSYIPKLLAAVLVLIAREQSGRELAPGDPTRRATAADVQETGLRPAPPYHQRRDLQHRLRPASFDQPTHPPPVPRQSRFGVDRLIRIGRASCARQRLT